jgi:U3 small nucleolar RNA-associated protein 10
MSELEQQLNYLKSVNVSTRSKELKKNEKYSFLFTGKESANQSISEVYEICQDGLKDLMNMDTRFREFQKTLFSKESINFNRELQNKETNKTLDENLSKFLRILSNYFLLEPSHKVIEYLVKRY